MYKVVYLNFKFCILNSLWIFLLFLSTSNAQVYTGDLTLSTQSEIDGFGYTSVTGILNIRESTAGNIKNLNGLSGLTSVGGDLIINFNDSLTSISGLSGLTSAGAIRIYGDNALTNLNGLSGITSTGSIQIDDDASLNNLGGLSNLTTVSQSINIHDMSSLTNLDGFSNLSTVGGNLYVQFNSNLEGFCGLYKLLSTNGLAGTFNVSDNAINPTEQEIINNGPCVAGKFVGDYLIKSQTDVNTFSYTEVTGNLNIREQVSGNIKNLNGLSGLTSVGGDLIINFNDSLASISGLSGLTSAGAIRIYGDNALKNLNGLSGITTTGSIQIDDDSHLTNIDGLSNITSVSQSINIHDMYALADLDGFSKLSSVGGNLYVQFNAQLEGFCGLYKLFSTNGLVGTYTVNDNPANPTSQDIVNAGSCVAGKFVGNYYVISQAIADSFKFPIVTGSLIVREQFHGNIKNLSGLSVLTTVGGHVQVNFNDSLRNINGLSHVTSAGGIAVYGDNVLTDISGLSGITSTGSIQIDDNASLNNLDGLSHITSVTDFINMHDLFALTNLNAFSNLATVGGNLYVQFNPDLSEFCGLYKLISTNGLGGTYNVSDNASNPTEQDIINSGPCQPIADAGSDQTVLNGATVQLDGSGSVDFGNNPLTYKWSFFSKPAGSSARFTDSTSVHGKFKTDLTGTYIIRLVVNDGFSNSDPDTVSVFAKSLVGAIQNAIDSVQVLPLSKGNKNSLISKLQGAIAKYNIGDYKSAANKLTSFINQLYSFVAQGYLTLNRVQPLINYVTSIINVLNSILHKPAENIDQELPSEYSLSQNYPNPFNPATAIRFSIPKSGYVQLKIYDILGREVTTLVDGNREAGNYSVSFDGSRYASGMYIYRLTAGNYVSTKKMLMIK